MMPSSAATSTREFRATWSFEPRLPPTRFKPQLTSLVGHVHLRDRKVQPSRPLRLAATTIAAFGGASIGDTFGRLLLGTEPFDWRVCAAGAALGNLITEAVLDFAEKRIEGRGEQQEWELVTRQRLTLRQQTQRVIDLANAQPLNEAGLARCIRRLMTQDSRLNNESDPFQVAKDMASLGRGALYLPTNATRPGGMAGLKDLCLITTAIRGLHEADLISTAQCVAALQTLERHILERTDPDTTLAKTAMARHLQAETEQVSQGLRGALDRIAQNYHRF